MTLHPGSLQAAYAKLQEYGFDMATMRNACERAAYSGSFPLRPVLVTFDREHGYRVIRTFVTNPDPSYLASLAAEQAREDEASAPATDRLAASTCPGEWGPAHKWLVMASCHGPASPYGCQHCPATAIGAQLGIPSEDEMRAAVAVRQREDYEQACAAGGSWKPGRTVPSAARMAGAS